jgi:hypothetical protein
VTSEGVHPCAPPVLDWAIYRTSPGAAPCARRLTKKKFLAPRENEITVGVTKIDCKEKVMEFPLAIGT